MLSWLNACLCSAPFLDSSATWRRFCLNRGSIHHKKLIFVRYCWDFYISPLGCLKGASILALPLAAVYWKVRWNTRHSSYFGASLGPCFATLQTPIFSWLIQVWGVLRANVRTAYPPPTKSSPFPLFPLVHSGSFCGQSEQAQRYHRQRRGRAAQYSDTPPHTSQFAELFTFPPQPATMRRNLVSVSLGRQSSRLKSRVKACGSA